jgi:hypothetical protein
MGAIKYALEVKNIDKHINKKIKNKDTVNLITQYFPSNNKRRFKENLFCLHKNLKNPYIDNIYLLNEKIYTCKELGFSEMPEKIKQIDIGHRLKFKDVFEFVNNDNKIKGYIIISNLDIYFNSSLKNIYYTSMKIKKVAYCQLRNEFYLKMRLKLNMNRSWSQDTWIYHTNNPIKHLNKFNYYFGQPGCDIKTNFLLGFQGFKCCNHPSIINCIHVHYGMSRNYKHKHVKGPHLKVKPVYNAQK